MHECYLPFIFNCPLISFFLNLIVYFLKKNYSLRQNIFKNFEGLREVTHISPSWYLFGYYWSWDLIGNRQHEGHWRFAEESVTRRYTGLWSPAFGQFTGGEPAVIEWSDSAIQRPVRRRSCVWSSEEDIYRIDRTLAASGQLGSDAFSRDSRGFGPLWNRLDSRWQRSVIATRASG